MPGRRGDRHEGSIAGRLGDRKPPSSAYGGNPGFIDYGLGGFLATQPSFGPAGPEMGKHKVPTLRNVDLRPYPTAVKAYTHNGVFKSLQELVHFYNTRDVLPRCEVTPFPVFGVNCWPAPRGTSKHEYR